MKETPFFYKNTCLHGKLSCGHFIEILMVRQ